MRLEDHRSFRWLAFRYLPIFVYFIAINAFQLGKGFDAFFVRFAFVFLMTETALYIRHFEVSEYALWKLGFWAFYFFSSMWAANTTHVLYYVNNFVQIMGLALCLPILIKDDKDLDAVLFLLLMSILITAIRLYIKTPVSAWGVQRVGDAIGLHSNDVGVKMALGAVISIYMMHRAADEHRGLKKNMLIILYLAIAAIFVIEALFTGSKKSIVSIILGIGAYEIIRAKGLKFLIVSILVIVLAVFLYRLIMTNEMLYHVLGRRIEKLLYTVQGGTGQDTDSSYEERRWYVQQAQTLFFQHPIIGYGGNNFVTYMQSLNYRHVAYSHNNYWELLSTLGIIGFLLHYILWVKVEVLLILKLRKKKEDICLLLAILIAIDLVMDIGMVSYISDIQQLTLLFGFLLVRKESEKRARFRIQWKR